jgi:hypothetical protein
VAGNPQETEMKSLLRDPWFLLAAWIFGAAAFYVIAIGVVLLSDLF